MANTPKKVKDPTEVALAAIQEARNIEGSVTDSRSRSRGDAAPEVTASVPSFDEPSFDPRSSNDRPDFDTIEEPRSSRRAANDDRPAIVQDLQALQRGRAGGNAYTFAALASLVWVVAGILLVIGFGSSVKAAMGEGAGGMLALAGLIALLAAPALMFFVMANLSSRGR